MKIENSNITMFSSRTYLEKYEKSESLKMWVGNRRPDFEGRERPAPAVENPAQAPKDYILDLSDKAKAPQPAAESELNEELQLSDEDKLKIKLIEKFIEVLTGKKIKIKVAARDLKELAKGCDELKEKACELQNAQKQQPAKPQGWGLEYDCHEMQYEREETTFSAEGVIKTADGQEISFSLDLSMSREFMQEQNISIRAGDAVKVDPLVINFSGNAAQLTTTKFSFDLDSDGKEDQISFVKPGSGFLALDRNNDGVVNNGSELFGPSTGSGFAELAGYDEDGNGWIDETDSIFSKLRIWSMDAEGNNSLVALGQQGVGAIYLGSILSPFSIKDQNNNLQGQVASTGVFVKEDGQVGAVQQVDLTV